MFDFPNSPATNQVVLGARGEAYVWDGWKWVAGTGPTPPPGTLYLPVAGGTMSGPLNATATGGNTVRSMQDRWGEVINVKDYGAKGDGTTDDTAAINAAANAIPATGGTLYLPRGKYSTSATILLKSLTRMVGDGWGSVIAANAAWQAGTTYQLVLNHNYLATTITDHDIVVEDLAFDYTNIPNLGAAGPHGAYQAVSCRMTRNVQVRNCRFEAGTLGNDATAMVACDTTLIEGCVAYDFVNTTYDHWWNPRNAKVINCYAKGLAPGFCFNPEDDASTGPGYAANGFLASGNTIIGTTPRYACQLEPMIAGNTVSNVTVIGNTFSNASVFVRGATTGVTIANNTFLSMEDCPAIDSETIFGGTPDGIVVTGNVIVNPTTTGAAPIQISIDGAIIAGNHITGTALGTTPGIDTGTHAPTVIGNHVSNGKTNTNNAVAGMGLITAPNGGGFAWKDASGSLMTLDVGSDNHLVWDGTGSSGGQRLIMDMYQRSDTSAMTWSVPLVFNGAISGTGLAAYLASPPAIGATAPAAGTFSTLNTQGNATVGQGAANPFLNVNGGNSGAGAGPGIALQWGGTSRGGLAGYSAYFGGAYDSRTVLAGYDGLILSVAGQTNTCTVDNGGYLNAATGLRVGTATGPSWTTGSAAPAATAPVGSLYSRVGGAVGATLYVSRGAGTWTAVAGV